MSEQTDRQIKAAAGPAEKLSGRLEDIKSAAEKAAESLAECERLIAEKEQLVSLNEEKKNELHSRREEISRKMSDLQIRRIELIKDKEAAQNEIRQLEEQSRTIGSNAADLAVQLNEQLRIIEEKEKLLRNVKTLLLMPPIIPPK
jgi:chromosome segregation protein